LGTLSLRDFLAHLWASCAKPTAGLMIEHLTEAGRIDETGGTAEYIPARRDMDWHSVTLRDAMDVTPGMDCEENEATRAW